MRHYISNRNDNRFENRNKPLYYSEYFINDNKEEINYSYILFIVFISICVFLPSILDIIYSYLQIDSCQELTYISSLNIWLRVSGIYGLVYYFLMFISLYCLLFKYTSHYGYTRLMNQSQKIENEQNESIYKIFSSIFTIFLLIIYSIETYIYFSFYNINCSSYSIIVYMWIRLITGIISGFFILFYINICYIC